MTLKDELILALHNLVKLKKHKDKNGKDDFYLTNQSITWKYTKQVLNKVSKSKKEKISGIMKINEVREKYPNYKTSYLPKKDFIEGSKDRLGVRIINKTKYDEVYLAKVDDNNHYLLYPNTNHLTGAFANRQKAIDWFKHGGR